MYPNIPKNTNGKPTQGSVACETTHATQKFNYANTKDWLNYNLHEDSALVLCDQRCGKQFYWCSRRIKTGRPLIYLNQPSNVKHTMFERILLPWLSVLLQWILLSCRKLLFEIIADWGQNARKCQPRLGTTNQKYHRSTIDFVLAIFCSQPCSTKSVDESQLFEKLNLYVYKVTHMWPINRPHFIITNYNTLKLKRTL